MANQYTDEACEEELERSNQLSPVATVKMEPDSNDEGEEPVGCRLCGQVFASAVELQHHAKEEHVNEYICGMDIKMPTLSTVIKNQFETTKLLTGASTSDRKYLSISCNYVVDKDTDIKNEIQSGEEDFEDGEDYTEYFALPDVNVEILNPNEDNDNSECFETTIRIERLDENDEDYHDEPVVNVEHLYPEQKLDSDEEVQIPENESKKQVFDNLEEQKNSFLENLGINVNGLGINSLKSLLTKYSCYICRYETNEESVFKNHLLTHTAATVNKRHIPHKARIRPESNAKHKPYSCKVCKRKFAQISHLNTHKVTHTGEKPYSCDICDRRFAQSSHLNTHKVTHTGEKPYTCEICNRKFAQSSHLNTHKVTHTGERPYSCDICDRKFAQSSHLNTHKLTHTGERPYSCDICDQKFFQNSHLNAHKVIHTGYKPYSCDLCNRRFFKINQLNVHVRIHLEGKLFTCNVCKHKFSTSSDLDRHARTHTGEKPFGCNLCDRRFSRKSDLNEHVRTHTGEKPYNCEVCNVKFSHRSTLFVHKKKHKAEEPIANTVTESKKTRSKKKTRVNSLETKTKV